MRRVALLVLLMLGATVIAAPVPLPKAREAEQLVEKLGSPDFAEREAATARLDELGALALEALRGACKSDNPEIADRAKDLVRKIERRLASDRLLAPTTVQVDAKDTALDDVLAALSKQAGCEVVLGGLKVEELAAKKVTVATGKVPFWSAVLKVCDAAGLQVAGAGGFVAPGSLPYRPASGAKIRVAADANRAVILEARDNEKKRPASVHGAVLVEALESPKGAVAPQANTLLQLWPEPRLGWESVSRVRVTKAVDAEGRKLTPDLAAPIAKVVGGRNPVNPAAFASRDFSPNVRQALVKFKPGEWVTPVARELTGSAFGLVRPAPEPLVVVALDPAKRVDVVGKSGPEVRASIDTDPNGKMVVTIQVTYDRLAVQPALATADLPDSANEGRGGNGTVHGLRVADADGRAFAASLVSARDDSPRAGRLTSMTLKLELIPTKNGPTKPAKVTFWGTVARPVEIPFALKDVPLAGGRR